MENQIEQLELQHDAGGEYYTVKGKRFSVANGGDYNVTVVNGTDNLNYWGIDKEKLFPKKHIYEIGVPIALVITERKDDEKKGGKNEKDPVVAIVTGLGFSGGYGLNKEIANGEVVTTRIVKDGLMRDLADGDKSIYVIQNKEITVGEGEDQRTKLYGVLSDNHAKHLIEKVIGNKNGLINSPIPHAPEENSYKFPMEIVSLAESLPSPLRVASDGQVSSPVPKR